MNPDRRLVLNGGMALGAVALVGDAMATPETNWLAAPDPGKPGDFDFLQGEWRIKNQHLRKPGEWDYYDGEATVRNILGGVASIEELRIPARDFSGMGLRTLDREKKVWSDYWMNAKSGVIGSEGVTGGFVKGEGVFISEDIEDGKPVKYLGLWDLITNSSCRWRQGASRDGGVTWEWNWIMDWTRV